MLNFIVGYVIGMIITLLVIMFFIGANKGRIC